MSIMNTESLDPDRTGPALTGGVQLASDNASPAGFIGPTLGRVLVYRGDAMPRAIRSGDAVYVGDVLESEIAGAVNVTVVGMTTLSVSTSGRIQVVQSRETD